MAYGLKIINDSSKIIIDQNYGNYVLHESGSLTLTYDGSPLPITLLGTQSFANTTSVPPLIAIKPDSSYHTGLKKYTKSGVNFTGFELGGDINNGGNITIDWMSFIPAVGHTSNEQYGLVVKDSSGKNTFVSGASYLKILNVLTSSLVYSQGTTTPNSDNLAHTTGTHYFISYPYGLLAGLYNFNPVPFPVSWIMERCVGFKYVNTTTVSLGEVFFNETSVGEDARGSLPYGFWADEWGALVVKDVT